MNHFLFYRCLIIFFAGILIACNTDNNTGRPNVILILTDDQGYGEVGANGNELISTPNLDALYSEGVRLEDFHVNNVCAPSRAALMTGKSAAGVGVWHTLGGRNILNIEETTMGDLFSESGYQTYMVGKWHLGDNYPYRPEDRGFSKVFRIGGGSLGQVADFWNNHLWDGHYWNGQKWVKTEGYCTDVQFDAAIDFINSSGEEPFFLYLATTAPHAPVGADKEYVDPYLEIGLQKKVAEFYGMVTNIDTNLGRLRSYLRKRELEENTLFIFMSDNGSACAKKDTSIYNAGMRGKKGSDYEGGHRVPCFIYWPGGGITGGRAVPELTAHIDLLPTLAEACNLLIPDSMFLEGISLLPILTNQVETPGWTERYLVTEGKVNNRDKLFSSSCVMQDQWRLVKGTELYNVRKDSSQDHVIDNQVKTKSMKKMYLNWLEQVSCAFEKQYCFQYLEQNDHVPFVSMDLLPFGNKKQVMKTVWNQGGVKKGMKNLGYWNIKFPEKGKYHFILSRFPFETSDTERKKMTDMNITGAAVWVDGVTRDSVDRIERERASFELELDKGSHKIAAIFENPQGDRFSAYYLYISRIQ